MLAQIAAAECELAHLSKKVRWWRPLLPAEVNPCMQPVMRALQIWLDRCCIDISQVERGIDHAAVAA
jgi:hypothetical protein